MLNYQQFKQSVNDKMINHSTNNKSNKKIERLFQPFNNFKNCFYFENLTDNCFFDISGAKNDFFEFYKKIIKSGVGCIILGGVYLGINNHPNNNICRISLNEDIISSYKKIATLAHSYQCKVFLQVKSIYGRYNHLYNYTKKIKIASNFGPDPLNKQRLILRISDNKCNELINDFYQVNTLSKIANFDGIVIDATYTNIIGELSSDEYNNRVFGYYSNTDDFLKRILKYTHETEIIVLKINITSLLDNYKNANSIRNIENNNTISNITNKLITYIKHGVDGFEFIFGREENKYLHEFNNQQDELIFEEFYISFKEIISKQNIKNKFNEDVIIFCHDNFTNFQKPLNLINKNIINLINITRNIYSDLEFLKKLKNNISHQKCIKCSICDEKAQFNNKIECTINPKLLNFNSIDKIKKKGTVAIIGSGISGQCCALTLLERGFNVYLFEKESMINPTGKMETIYKSDTLLENYFIYMEKLLKQYSIKNKLKISLNYNFSDKDNLTDYDYIILASGFNRKLLAVVGAVQPHVYDIYDVLKNESLIKNKKNIVIYAKTILSLKLASYLSMNNYLNITIIIQKVDEFFKSKNANIFYFFRNLYKNKVTILFYSKAICINEDNVDVTSTKDINPNSSKDFDKILSGEKFKNENKYFNIDCDIFIYEPKITPNNSLYHKIISSGYPGEVFVVGNALENSTFDEVIKSAYFVAKNL